MSQLACWLIAGVALLPMGQGTAGSNRQQQTRSDGMFGDNFAREIIMFRGQAGQ